MRSLDASLTSQTTPPVHTRTGLNYTGGPYIHVLVESRWTLGITYGQADTRAGDVRKQRRAVGPVVAGG